MIDKTNVFLCLLVATLLLIVFYLPSPPRQEANSPKNEVETDIMKELIRFQGTMKKFVSSIGDIERRLQVLEQSVKQIQIKQESFHVNLQEKQHKATQLVQEKPVKQSGEVDAVHKEEMNNPENFIGEIKRDGYCFDSAEHALGGTVELWRCHKQGRNQEFQIQEGRIKHKSWCLAVEKTAPGENVVLKDCNDSTSMQEWLYHDRLFKAGETNLCIVKSTGSGPLTLTECNPDVLSQQWHLEKS